MTLALRDGEGGCVLPVRVHPGAKKDAINGVHDGALRVSLSAPPADGRANAALVAFLADLLDVPRARITLVTGASSRTKTLRIAGVTREQVEAKLLSTQRVR